MRLRGPAPLWQCLGTVAHQVTVCEDAADERVTLEMLKGGVRIEQRILVFETDHETDRDASVGHRVEPAAAKLLFTQRVAERVDDGARLQPILRDVPQFFDANRKLRRLAGDADLQLVIELLGEMAANAVGEDGDLGVNIGTWLEGTLRLAVLADAAIARPHADDPTLPPA